MKYQSNLFNLKASIIEDDQLHQVKEILSDGEDFFSKINKRSLVLLLCQNQYESIFFYINAICRSVVPILLDSKIDSELLNILLKEYEPDFIFAPSLNEINYNNYHQESQFKNYKLFSRQEKKITYLHPDLSLLLSTSGTTGSPKLVRLSLKNLISNASSISKYLNLNCNDVAISSLPMNYSFGLSIINSHLFIGASIVMTNESITQREFWKLFKKNNVTSLSGVPYTYEIIKKFKLLNAELPSLKTLTQAGGKLSNELILYFSELSNKRGLKFFVMYGQTEGTARLSYLDPDYTIDKLGSIGKPIPNGEFHLIDENGTPINESYKHGQLIYLGENVMLGYAQSKRDLFNGDENNGCLKTGDIAYFDNDNFYYIVGRIKRFIKLFGNRVNLDEIEKLLLEKNIESACTGKDGMLIVFILNNDDKSFVYSFLNQNLRLHSSAFQVIIINTFPKSSSGKTLYSKLPFS